MPKFPSTASPSPVSPASYPPRSARPPPHTPPLCSYLSYGPSSRASSPAWRHLGVGCHLMCSGTGRLGGRGGALVGARPHGAPFHPHPYSMASFPSRASTSTLSPSLIVP